MKYINKNTDMFLNEHVQKFLFGHNLFSFGTIHIRKAAESQYLKLLKIIAFIGEDREKKLIKVNIHVDENKIVKLYEVYLHKHLKKL